MQFGEHFPLRHSIEMELVSRSTRLIPNNNSNLLTEIVDNKLSSISNEDFMGSILIS